MVSNAGGELHSTIPMHNLLKLGMLGAIISDVMTNGRFRRTTCLSSYLGDIQLNEESMVSAR